jgi:hypothetical protein
VIGMPQYPPKKESHRELKFTVQTHQNKYLLTVRQSSSSILLYIGGQNQYCIECQIFPGNPIGHLSKIAYDEKCSLTNRFERGTDTKAIMALICSYLQNEYGYVKKLTFQDMSYRECSEKQTIDLAAFYYLLYGQTWYMLQMSATIPNKQQESLFKATSKDFLDKKASTTWSEFDKYITSSHPLPESDMITIYNNSKSWSEYFTVLRNKIGVEELCSYMAPWVTQFVKQMAQIQFTAIEFEMSVKNPQLPVLEYTLSPYIAQSAGKYTRKRRASLKRRDRDLR